MAYITSNKNQNYLLPPKITDLFSKGHICYLIEQIADSINYSEFDKKYAGAGHPAYHPRIIIKLLLMANIDGVRSSRRIAKNSQENVVYIYLAEKTSPDFRTISDFRKANLNLIKDVFLQLNKFALEHGLIDLSHLMIDGTTLKANANNDKIIDKETLEKIKKHIDRVLKEGIKVDEEEDNLYGDRGMHELPKELNDSEKRRPIVRKIVDKINKSSKRDVKKIKKEISKLGNKMKCLKRYSFIDEDARFMLTKKGKIELCYNAQLVTDKTGLIISNDIVQEADDRHQLVPNIERVEQDFGKLEEKTKVSADSGFENGNQMEKLERLDLYIPGKNMSRARGKPFSKANFNYDEKKDVYICPEDKILKNVGKYYNKNKEEYLTIYKCQDCQTCLHKEACCKKSKQRVIHALPQDNLFNRIKKKLMTKEGRYLYNLRKQTVERSFGDIKHNKGFRSFLLRGLKKVKIEFNLACIAHNLVIINNLLNRKRIGC